MKHARILALNLLVISTVSLAQWSYSQGILGLSGVYGTLIVRARLDSHPPENYFVTLSSLTSLSNPGPFIRKVANLGTFRFERVIFTRGEWELTVIANGKVLLKRAFSVDSSDPEDIHVNLLLNWKDESNWSTNRITTVSAEELYPRNPASAALMNKEKEAVESDDNKTAVRLLKMIVDKDPRDYGAWAELGTVLFAQGKDSESEKALKQALKLKPSYPLALLSFGKFHYINKRYQAAIGLLTQLISKHPEVAEAHRYIGEAYLRMQDALKAEPELQKALQLDRRGQAEAHLSLAAIYDAAGQKGRAAREYESFLEVWPEYADKSALLQYIALNKNL